MSQALLLAAVVLAILAGGAPAAAAQEKDAPWRVLILDSTDASELVPQYFGQGVREVLVGRAQRPIEFYTEFLDALRFQGTFHEQEFATFLKRKYENRRPDLIVSVLPEAFAFVEGHREALWPNTPVVFVGVPDDLPRVRAPGPGITGILTRVDFSGTLDLALRLKPGTRRVAVVTGASDFDRLWRVRAEAALHAFDGRLDVTYLDGLPMVELLSAVAALPPDSIVLHGTVFRDGTGHATRPREVARKVAEAARVPVFGTFEPSLGTGSVGASIVSLESQGRRAGELALRILNGEEAGSIPIDTWPPPRATVDWRQMRRFGFSESLLPPDAVVLFRPTSIWEQYQGRIIAAGSLLVLQSVLIVALLIERRQRHRAERQAQQQRVELAHASRLATVGEITATIAHQVNQPLGAILTNADAAEILLEADPLPLDELRQVIADIKRDDERASDVIHGVRELLRKRDAGTQSVDVNALVSEVHRVVAGEARHRRIAMELALAPGLPRVDGNRVHLQQVVLNLVMNALDAVGEQPDDVQRCVVIRTQASGSEVHVAVADTGPGILPERLPRVFESFFTTKRDGMGLGLSIARSLIDAQGGRIWAETNESGGATFRFSLLTDTLPRSHDSADVKAAATAPAPARQSL